MSSRFSRPGRRLGIPAALTIAVTVLLAACSSGGGGNAGTPTAKTGTPTGIAKTTPPSTSTSTSTTDTGSPVHVSLLEGDGGVYGIGMPIIAYFNRKVTDATAFAKAAKVSVNGAPADGAWYWEKSGRQGQVLEAHYRLRQYWPAHAKIDLDLPVKGAVRRDGPVV